MLVFEGAEHQLTAYLKGRTNEQEWVGASELALLKHELVAFYASEFTGGSLPRARRDLEENPIVASRRKDTMPTCFFLGLSLGFLVVILALFFTPLEGDFSVADTYPSLPAFRFSFVFNLVLLSCAVLVYLFRLYRINYVLIFGLDMSDRLR